MSLKNKKGMTLIEILIVVTIIASLFAIVFQTVSQRRKKAQVALAKTLIGKIEQTISEFEFDCGFYPESLTDLVEPVADCESWGPDSYLKNGKLPKDPWNNNLGYRYNDEENQFEIISFGADRKEGGTSFNADISSLNI